MSKHQAPSPSELVFIANLFKINQANNKNNKQALLVNSPKFFGVSYGFLNVLITVGHMYSFSLFYSIKSQNLCYFLTCSRLIKQNKNINKAYWWKP